MNFSRMQTLSRLNVGETDETNSYYSPTEVEDLVNDAIEQVGLDTECLLTYSTVTTVEDQGRYSLPTDFSQMKYMEIDRSSTLRYVLAQATITDFALMTSGNYTLKGQPAYYKLEIGATTNSATRAPGDVSLYPIPDDNGDDNYTLRMYYNQVPNRLSGPTEVSELPIQLHRAVTFYAGVMLTRKTSDDKKGAGLMQLYNGEIKKFMDSKNQREARSFVAKDVYKADQFWRRLRPQGWK